MPVQSYCGNAKKDISGKRCLQMLNRVTGVLSAQGRRNSVSKRCRCLPESEGESVYHRNIAMFIQSWYGNAERDINGKLSQIISKLVNGVGHVTFSEELISVN